jgi:hypothetical protein
VLLPLNIHGTNAQTAFDAYIITNIAEGSPALWVHFAAVWAFSFLAFRFLYALYGEFATLRLRHMCKPRPENYSGTAGQLARFFSNHCH